MLGRNCRLVEYDMPTTHVPHEILYPISNAIPPPFYLVEKLCERVGARLELGVGAHGLAYVVEHLDDVVCVHGNL